MNGSFIPNILVVYVYVLETYSSVCMLFIFCRVLNFRFENNHLYQIFPVNKYFCSINYIKIGVSFFFLKEK